MLVTLQNGLKVQVNDVIRHECAPSLILISAVAARKIHVAYAKKRAFIKKAKALL